LAESEGEIRPTTADAKGAWAGERSGWAAADHPSATRGEAFSLWLGEKVVAEIITHDPSVAEMADLIAEDGIGVSEEFRGRGYGKAILSYWTREMQKRGRICLHSTSADNAASLALARSVGYVEYAQSRSVVLRRN
jgi:GNAT superfamily N-acetyltransferase